MSSEISIKIENLSKCYEIYEQPRDRLKQFLLPRFQQLLGTPQQRYFNEFWALRDVSFEVKRGQTIGIIGRNGSGKSTLLQLICGTLNPSAGSIQTRGRVAALLELGSGFNPEFSGRENVYMNGAVLGLTREEIDRQFSAIEAFADIGAFIEQPVKTYSSGMYVRLAFAVIAHVNADILIVDEALAVGDAFFTQKCMRFLREFMETGTVLFVSHDTGAIKSLCSHVIWLDKGRVLQQGSPKEVSENYLKAFYAAQPLSPTKTSPAVQKPLPIANTKDQRLDFINTSPLRNDIQVFTFEDNGQAFGAGGARIHNACLLEAAGQPLSWIVGGENVILKVEIAVLEPLRSPIVGFGFKDRLGQVLFGDNTWLTYMETPVECKAQGTLAVEFHFQMPRLQSGNYFISIAVADGTQDEHVQHHWVHDAILLKSESTSVSSGIIGLPMSAISLTWSEHLLSAEHDIESEVDNGTS